MGGAQDLRDLVSHQLLVFMGGRPRALTADDGERSGSFPPAGARSRIVCDDGASMRIAARAGVGISMSSLWNVRDDISEGTLVRVLPDYAVEDRSALWLVYPRSNVLTAKVRVFIDYLVEKIGDPPIWQRG